MKIFLLALLSLSLLASAHGAGGTTIPPEEFLGLPAPTSIIQGAVFLIALALFFALWKRDALSGDDKKLLFLLIAVPAVFSSVYLAGFSMLLNLKSESGGPVHWHADYEVWACGERLELVPPKDFWINKVGSPLFHSHQDDRIHVEGVLIHKQDADLGQYFTEIGGQLTEDTLVFPTASGLKSFTNGDQCPNGRPGTLMVFINGALTPDAPDHVFFPDSHVPPGDRIKIVFTDKPASLVNTSLKEAP
ncbi:MAG TPA: hypothetical protein VGQ00_03385 [Candidatus Norongarragalinales archaeon]|jgi:hypothetical protein|nr:hypothetical protein [Candidatus Norongarragalinales archaeon]